MARYKALTRHFIAPHTIEEGTIFIIDDAWVPNYNVEPLDDAAREAMAKFRANRPPGSAEFDPIDDLPNHGDGLLVEETSGPSTDEPILSLAEANAAPAGTAKDGNAPPPPVVKK